MASSYKQEYPSTSSARQQLPKDGRKAGRKDRKDRYINDRMGYYKGAEVQNVKSARVYIFGDGDHVLDDENVEFEMPEMRSRLKGGASSLNNKSHEEEPAYFVREIADGETLQAIALKYSCPVSELKRLNKLIQDQEFFALKVLKVPMKKYGIISEEIATNAEHHKRLLNPVPVNGSLLSLDTDQEPDANYFDESDSQHDFSDPETQLKIMRTLSIRDNFSAQGKDAQKFLKKMDEDLKKIKQSSRAERESLSEVISVMTNKSVHPLQTSKPSNQLREPYCGISWWSVIIVSLVVGIIVPIVIFIYIKYVANNHG